MSFSAVNDLDLVRACLDGKSSEIKKLDDILTSISSNADLLQLTRHRLLIERRLEQFTGKGSLRRWLRTVMCRLEVDLSRANREHAVEAKVLDAMLPPGSHFEARVLKNEARAVLLQAVSTAFSSLSNRDQLFVRHAYLDGLSLTAIGQLYKVAPSTVMRAIDRSLSILRDAATANLSREERLGVASVESFVRAGLSV